jgi:hypothetical protein
LAAFLRDLLRQRRAYAKAGERDLVIEVSISEARSVLALHKELGIDKHPEPKESAAHL